jgi:hypothetical protein
LIVLARLPIVVIVAGSDEVKLAVSSSAASVSLAETVPSITKNTEVSVRMSPELSNPIRV